MIVLEFEKERLFLGSFGQAAVGMKMATSSQDPLTDTAFKDGTGYNVRDDNA